MKQWTLRTIVTTLALASMFLFGPTACKTKLEQGGAYAPGTWTTNTDNSTTFAPSAAADPAFYAVDAAYEFAYSVIDTAFKFEKNNRDYLWSLSHDIKHTLDDIRPKAVEANQRYLKARRIYILTPTPAGLSDLQAALSQIQNFSKAAQGALPRS